MLTNGYQERLVVLGRRIQSIRKARGFSQEKAGELVALDRVTIGYIEQGRRAPSLQTLFALAEAYKVDVIDFFTESDISALD